MFNHENLFEINTRVWLYNLNKKHNEDLKLINIPESIWEDFYNQGFKWIWLMGVWKPTPVKDFHPSLEDNFKKILLDLKKEDYIGSPYSIVDYEINPQLGSEGDLEKIKNKLNYFGLKLMLDFIPNHFGISTPLKNSHPEYFICKNTDPKKNSGLFYRINEDLWIAHGKDPYYPPWDDTLQLNYYNEETREYMTKKLLKIADQCDGVRCDMAMLCLNDIVEKTWGWILTKQKYNKPENEFWDSAITDIKSKYPDFNFLAEVYWDLGWQLQKLGFDYTYDKRLYDRLLASENPGSLDGVYGHLLADIDYQNKSVRFIENHDEERALTVFGRDRSLAAAAIMGTIPGLKLYHQGQLEGKTVRIPVQLRRVEDKTAKPQNNEIKEFYLNLLEFTNRNINTDSKWNLLGVIEAHEGDNTFQNILAWTWIDKKRKKCILIIVNYSKKNAQGILTLDIPFDNKDDLKFIENNPNQSHKKVLEKLHDNQFLLKIESYRTHLFQLRQRYL
jgi:glycosidase